MRQAVEVAEVARAEAAQVDQANAEALAEAAQARKRAQLTAKQADGLVEEAKTKGGLATQTLRHAIKPQAGAAAAAGELASPVFSALCPQTPLVRLRRPAQPPAHALMHDEHHRAHRARRSAERRYGKR